jgi:hypothetical protein
VSPRGRYSWLMAKCPTCGHEVRTPLFLNLDAWRHLTCAQCNARLEMKPPRSGVLAPLIAPLFVLARHGSIFQLIAVIYTFATIFLLLLESLRPRVQLRKKPLPEPEIRLSINGPSN